MKKISMVIVAISAMISLSGCHEDPTYVESYFQRQSVIEELSNELKGQYYSIFIPVIYNASQEQMDYKSYGRVRSQKMVNLSSTTLLEDTKTGLSPYSKSQSAG